MLGRIFGRARIDAEDYLPPRDFGREGRYKWITPRWLIPFAMLFPAALLLILLNISNALYGVYLSFLDWNYLRVERRLEVVGLYHYYAVFTDPNFFGAIKRTFIYAAVVVSLSYLAGLYFALLLNEEVKAKGIFRTMILMPWAIPLVVVGVLWSFAFQPGIGPLSDLLAHLGMPQMKYINWLGDPRFAFLIVMGVQIWRWAPFFAITLLAGLQSIADDLYESAEIDGAGAIDRFWYITLPLLRPVTAVVLLQGLIWSFYEFVVVFVMTKGGPANSTELLSIYLWRLAFRHGQVGTSAAVGVILVLILSTLGTMWVIFVLKERGG